MVRLGWPMVVVCVALVAVVARRPGLLFSRAFAPVLLVVAILVLVQYAGRPRHPRR